MDIKYLIKQEVKKLVQLLVDGEYEKLEKMNKIGVLKANELEKGILQYGGVLTLPLDEAFDEMDIFKLDNPRKYCEEYFIDIELWINGCKSDLTLSCEGTVNKKNEVNVIIYSVHVL